MKINIENKISEKIPKLSEKFLRDEFINIILKYKIESNSYDDDFTLEQDLEKKILSENSFLESVINSILLAKKEHSNRKIVILFDIDETIAANTYVTDATTKTFIRPSIPTLFTFLKQEGVQIGLLSSRSEIQSQLDDSNNLQSIQSYITPEFILSTRNTLSEIKGRELSNKYNDKMFAIGDFEKINFLEEFINKNPDLIVIPVDDLEYPKLFDYGVALSPQEKFFI